MIYGIYSSSFYSLPSFKRVQTRAESCCSRLFRFDFSRFEHESLWTPWTGPTFDVSTRCPRTRKRPIDRAMRYIARIPLDLCRCWEGEKEEKGRGRGKNGKDEIKEEKEGKNGRGKEREVVRQRGESMGMGCEGECRAGAFKKTEHAGSVER